jgi:mannitol/fructose-specific phosphotransferase system IIA component (Ntr-type)
MKITELNKYLNNGLFLPDLKADSKPSVMEELVQRLVDNNFVKSKGLVLDTLSKRETLGSTGIGKGVAVPHCRTLAVSDVYIVVGISRKGVDFDASDKKKVNLFFLIVAPPLDGHNLYLPILGKVVEMVRDAKLRQAMISADNYSSFIKIFQGG